MKPKNNENGQGEILTALENIKKLLQDLFILESLRAGVLTEDVRKMMQLRLDRVTHISKRLKKANKKNHA